MATDAAALIEEVLAEIQRVGALRYAIVGVTHLTAGFGVLFMKQRMQPERIQTMSLLDARRSASVTAVTGRATKFLRVMDLQQFLARMTDESAG
jgi:hypothetical protein